MTHPTALEDFITRVNVAWNGCWLWTGSLDRDGYGRWFTRTPGYSQAAHRSAWQLLVAEIPPGLQIDHLCRVRHCVNPDHLEPVAAVVNVARGYGFTAQHGRKAHCKNGHPLDGDNVYASPGRHYGRVCKTCARERALSSYRRRTQATAPRSTPT